MVEIIYEQLKTPKSVEELHQRLKESGVKWNKAQLQLFLLMDSNIKKTGDLYSVGGNNLNTIILDIVDKVMDGKPVAPIKKIMEYIPNDITVSAEEISKIAEQSGKYKLHPNGAVLMRAKIGDCETMRRKFTASNQ
ncbi:hypothetical protein PQ690_02520 [Thermoanaerobacterium thermosaccharolyticum]|uniref:hypothetical protein n=1 Tax=Thermoanaerobacterium thermosaccharolyticum TaxID=1517 RepID=UPI003DA8FAAF